MHPTASSPGYNLYSFVVFLCFVLCGAHAMAKANKNSKGKKSASPPNNKKQQNKPPKEKRSRLDAPAQDWLNLLGNPCSGKLSRPCYAGTDAGYLIRTIDVLTIDFASTGLVPGSVVSGDILFQYTPYNVSSSTGAVIASGTKGATAMNVNSVGFNNFITTSNAVRAFRPVAGCIRWLPDGPYSTRQGTVGLLAAPNTSYTAGSVLPSVTSSLSQAQHLAPNGSEEHEVRWLPSAVDEVFGALNSSNSTGAGTVSLTLAGVDATATLATKAVFNGRLEVVTVWEWQPAGNNDVSLNLQAPLPYTSQQVLASVKDLSGFAYKGMQHAAMRAGYAGSAALLTAGVRTFANRGPGMQLRG